MLGLTANPESWKTLKRGDLRRGRGLVQLEADPREAPVEVPKDVGQDGRHGEAGEGDAQAPDAAVGHGLQVRGDSPEGGQNGLDPLDERRAGLGELDPAARAAQKPDPERGLELRNLAAESGLRYGECLRGLPEVKLARHLAEVHEVAQLKRELILPGHRREPNKYFPDNATSCYK